MKVYFRMAVNENRLYSIINEELSKADVSSLINQKISSELSSSDFKRKIREISADVVSELFKILWQRNNTWKSAVSRP